MNEAQIRAGLESGKQHPFPLLQHLAREGDEEGARLVAEMGPERLRGREKLRFRALVRELVPEVHEAEERETAARSERRSERKRKEQTTSLGDSLAAMNEAARRQREGPPLPTGGGWNLPLDA